MRKSIWFALTLSAAALAGGVIVLQAETPPTVDAGTPARTVRGGWGRAKEKLGLADEQLARIRKELRAEKPALRESIHQMQAARIELRGVVQKSGATEAEIRGAAAKVGAATGDLAVLRARLFARIRPILTPEQCQKLTELRSRADERAGGAIDQLTE